MKLLETLFSALLFTPFLGMAQEEKPNIILIVSDDQGISDAGFRGSPDIPPPIALELPEKHLPPKYGFDL